MNQYEDTIEQYGQAIVQAGRTVLALAQEIGQEFQIFDDGRVRIVISPGSLTNLDSDLVDAQVARLEETLDRLVQVGTDPLPVLVDSLYLRAPPHVLQQLADDLQLETYEPEEPE